MTHKHEALNWVKKYGNTNTDIITAMHVLDFVIDDALEVAETQEELKLINEAELRALLLVKTNK